MADDKNELHYQAFAVQTDEKKFQVFFPDFAQNNYFVADTIKIAKKQAPKELTALCARYAQDDKLLPEPRDYENSHPGKLIGLFAAPAVYGMVVEKPLTQEQRVARVLPFFTEVAAERATQPPKPDPRLSGNYPVRLSGNLGN